MRMLKWTILLALVCALALALVVACGDDDGDDDSDEPVEGCSPNLRCGEPDEVHKGLSDANGVATFQCEDGTTVHVYIEEQFTGSPIEGATVTLIRDGDYFMAVGDHPDYIPHLEWGHRDDFVENSLGIFISLGNLAEAMEDWYNELKEKVPEVEIRLFDVCFCADKDVFKKRIKLNIQAVSIAFGTFLFVLTSGTSDIIVEAGAIALETAGVEIISEVFAEIAWAGEDSSTTYWQCETPFFRGFYLDRSSPCGDAYEGEYSCDGQCWANLLKGTEGCWIENHICKEGCGGSESCIEACRDEYYECANPYMFEFEDCASTCPCLKDLFPCEDKCNDEDDACFEDCWHSFMSCTGWSESCWDECEEENWECWSSCGEDYICLNDCVINKTACLLKCID